MRRPPEGPAGPATLLLLLCLPGLGPSAAPRSLAAPPPPCSVDGGVVDPTRCAGYSATDATNALQAALHSGAHTVLLRNLGTPWLVSSVLWLGSNQTLAFSSGAVIEAKRWAPYWNQSNVDRPHPLISTAQAGSFNITLRGASGAGLRMHKQDYMNPKLYPVHNEWRYGLQLSSGSRGIRVFDLTIESTGGDGICMSYAVSDVHIARVTLNDNYRNALTITNAKDVIVEDTILSNTSGTGPSAGVDIEPDWPWTDLSNITFRRCQFLHNSGPGFSMSTGGLKAWNRTKFAGVPRCARARNNTACPMSVSIEQSHVEGLSATPKPCASPCEGAPGGGPPAADCHLFDCAGCSTNCVGETQGEQFGITFAGIRGGDEGAPGSFRVSDTTISNTALSGLLVSEKAATGAVFVLSNVTLDHTAANLTSYANWIWKAKGNPGWLNSPVVIQSDTPADFGNPGGIVLDGVTIVDDRPRPWLTTFIDPTTRLESIVGTVEVRTTVASKNAACSIEAGTPADQEDLGAVEVICATSSSARQQTSSVKMDDGAWVPFADFGVPAEGAYGLAAFRLPGRSGSYLSVSDFFGNTSSIWVNDQPNGSYSRFQTLPSRAGHAFLKIKMGGAAGTITHLFLCNYRTWPASGPCVGSGVLSAHEGDKGCPAITPTNSTLWEWDQGRGKFVLAQKILTHGTNSADAFTIAGQQYLAVANAHRNITNRIAEGTVNSTVYRWETARRQFVPVQQILTHSALDVKAFVIDTQHYLAFANSPVFAKSQWSPVFKWSVTSKRFEPYQNLTGTQGATGLEPFSVGDDYFLAVANRLCLRTGHRCNSTIYRWNASKLWEPHQTITSHGAYDWEFFSRAGSSFLALANHMDRSVNKAFPCDVDSVIYEYNTTSKMFVASQQLQTFGAEQIRHFTTNGSDFLAVAQFPGDAASTNPNVSSKVWVFKSDDAAPRKWEPLPEMGQR